MPRRIFLFLVLTIVLLAAGPARAINFTVTNADDSGAGSLRQAIADSNNAGGDNMIVFNLSAGTAPLIKLTTGSLTVQTNLMLVNDRAGDAPITIRVESPSHFDYRCLEVRAGSTLLLAGLTVIGPRGGGIYNAGELTLRNCILSDSVGNPGGAIYNIGKLTMRNCIVRNNSSQRGGGIYNFGGRVMLLDCTLSGNNSSSGGAIHNDGTPDIVGNPVIADMTLVNCILTDNRADDSFGLGGGGIANLGTNGSAFLTLVNCTFSNQRTFSNQYGGGALINFGLGGRAVLAAANCTFVNNQARNGGALYDYGSRFGTVTLNNCTFSANVASGGGGGAIYANHQYNNGSPAIVGITNSSFSGNFATNTEGTFISGGSITAGFQGTKVELANSLFRRGNNGAQNILSFNGATLLSHGHNLTDDSASGDGSTGPGGLLNGPGDLRNTDPLLGPLADNGGSTQTHALLQGSAAINAGGDTRARPRDQRGYARNGTSDIGAYEFEGALPVARLANISTRARCLTNDDVLIAGFIVTGSEEKKVMVRAIGPSLAGTTHLPNPTLELHNSSGQVLAFNDNWMEVANRQEMVDSAIAPTHDLESAILTTLSPGAYTAVVRGVDDSVGIALAEVYDLAPGVDSKLGNIATRGLVQTGDNVMIGGFIVTGPDSQAVVVRALGPSLPMQNRLADPELALYDANGSLLRENYDWRQWTVGQEGDVRGTGLAPANDSECAIAVMLLPGQYTAIVRGTDNSTGVALIEVYGMN